MPREGGQGFTGNVICRTEQAFIWDLSIPDRGPRTMVTFNRKPETLHERPRSGLRRFYKHAPMLASGARSVPAAACLDVLQDLPGSTAAS